MIDIHFGRLRTLGLAPALAHRAAKFAASTDDSSTLERLRLTKVRRDALRVQDGADERTARVLPRLTRTLAEREAMLAVGDWLLAATGGAGKGKSGGITPAVALTRADVIANVPGRLAFLGAGQTLVVLGSSGAGKSTLTNTLLGSAVQDTGAAPGRQQQLATWKACGRAGRERMKQKRDEA